MAGFEVEWFGDEILEQMQAATFRGAQLAAEHLLSVSSQLAPHEEGDLQRSGTVTSDPADGEVAVSFDRPYAVRQHEDMTLRHDEGRQAKYLEAPMWTEQDIMIGLMWQEGRKATGGS